MNGAIGDILPLAVGVAVSPVPIIAAILMLLSPKARVTGVGFMFGWLIGIVVAVTVFTLLSAVLPEQAEGPQPTKGVIQLILGALLLLVAVRQWKQRPRPGVEPKMPKWMQAIDQMNFVKAFGLAFLLAAINPKNLLLGAAAGVAIGAAGLSTGDIVLTIVIFTVIAASTVAIPVLAYLVAADKLRAPLGALRDWLTKENAVIMAILLLIIGVSLIGKGIGSF